MDAARRVRLSVLVSRAFNHSFEVNGTYVFDVEEEELGRINKVLEDVDEWEWDVWKLRDASKGRPLQALGWHLLHKYDLINQMQLDQAVVKSWLHFVEELYQDVPYHSSTHAADVLQALHHFICKCGAAAFLKPPVIFTLLLTAMIHDAGHDGCTNLYHVNAATERALAHNDQSVQENFHCASIFARMAADRRLDILAALPPAAAREARRLAIHITLGTDMKCHFGHVQELKGAVAAHPPTDPAWQEDPALADLLCSNLVPRPRPRDVGGRFRRAGPRRSVRDGP